MFSEQLKKLRESTNLSQSQFSNRLNVAKQTYCNWENGNAMPSISKLIMIADYFGISVDFLLGRENQTTLDITGLTEEELAPIRQLIYNLKNQQKKSGD